MDGASKEMRVSSRLMRPMLRSDFPKMRRRESSRDGSSIIGGLGSVAVIALACPGTLPPLPIYLITAATACQLTATKVASDSRTLQPCQYSN
jgi:hypothetical protein